MLADAIRGSIGSRPALLAGLTAIVAAAFLAGPRASPVLAPILALVIGAAAHGIDWRRELVRPPAAIAACLSFAAWAALAVLWSADRADAVGKVTLLVLFIATAGVAARSLPRLDDTAMHTLARAAFIGLAAGLAYLFIEEMTGQAIKALLYRLVPGVRPSLKHLGVDGEGTVTHIAEYLTNHNMAALTLSLWPLLLLARHQVAALPRWIAAAGILVLAALTIGHSQHDTSVLALILAVPVFLAMWGWPRPVLALVAAGWVTATLLMVPITGAMYHRLELHQAKWLAHTARQRVILWGYTSDQVPLRPILGVGTNSTKVLDQRRGRDVPTPPGYVYQWRSGPHGHNIYLQTWYELGAPGALLLCLAGLLVLRGISRSRDAARPYLAAAFVAAAVTAALTWGLWQAWFMAAFALSASLAMLAAELDRRQGRREQGMGNPA